MPIGAVITLMRDEFVEGDKYRSEWSFEALGQILECLQACMEVYLTRRRSIFNVLRSDERDFDLVSNFNESYFGGG